MSRQTMASSREARLRGGSPSSQTAAPRPCPSTQTQTIPAPAPASRINSAFTVRKTSNGVGVERVFQTHSPIVDSIEVKRRGDVRQAKLYYLRELSGRKARIKEKLAKR